LLRHAQTQTRSLSSTRWTQNASAENDPSKSEKDVSPKDSKKISRFEDQKFNKDQPSDAYANWDEEPDLNISAFSELPFSNFGVNQHMLINDEFKEELRSILWQFRAPIRYAFAYGSGVFSQTSSTSSKGEGKMIDMIFGVSHTQHWHSLNLQQHRDHYSGAGALGSGFVSRIQDNFGAGVYFNPYITVNGRLIKYGVVNLDTLCRDLSEWDTLYLAGRLQKPVKILRDDPRVRLANQINLMSALRTALLLLPEKFHENELYAAVAGISYLGDPRMALPAENRNKVSNIVTHQMTNFRRLYAPLIQTLPNVEFKTKVPDWQDPTRDTELVQDMEPSRRGNMVRRLPKKFRQLLYFHFQRKYQIPQLEFNKMIAEAQDEDSTGIRQRLAGPFEKRIGGESDETLHKEVSTVIRKAIGWPSTMQTLKGPVTAGFRKTIDYLKEKWGKWRDQSKVVPAKEEAESNKSASSSSSSSDASSKSEDGEKQERKKE
jgi:translocator assembly and maintenance protein 41